MKARHIKKLRERIKTFNTYEIRKSVGLFGDFFGCNRLGLVMDNYYITADNPELALKRFFRYYERSWKRKHDYYTSRPQETTERWGRIIVKNLKSGFMTFYR